MLSYLLPIRIRIIPSTGPVVSVGKAWVPSVSIAVVPVIVVRPVPPAVHHVIGLVVVVVWSVMVIVAPIVVRPVVMIRRPVVIIMVIVIPTIGCYCHNPH